MPVRGIITSSCGERENPILGRKELHDGLDIAVPEGTAVAAVRSGKVTKVRTSATLGQVVEFETEDGFRIMYAHLLEPCVIVGQKVQQGQVVAKSGNTGLSTGPHLHYSVWKNGELIDPMQFVDLAYTNEVAAEYEARGDKL